MPNFEDYIYNDRKDQDITETIILKEKQISYGALAEEYRILWDTLNVRQSRITEIDLIVDNIRENQAIYQTVADPTHVPWYVIAAIHYLESALDFTTHLHNGDPLSGYTIHEPAGRLKTHEPPFTWEESAIDALTYDGLNAIADWSIEKIAYHLEAYNGFGYRRHHPNVKSPYLWSFSNHYEKGRYIGDRHWSEDSVSDQCGAMVLICQMIARGIIVSPPMDGDAPFANATPLISEPAHESNTPLQATDDEPTSVEVEQGVEQPIETELGDMENIDDTGASEAGPDEVEGSRTSEAEPSAIDPDLVQQDDTATEIVSELPADAEVTAAPVETEALVDATPDLSNSEQIQIEEPQPPLEQSPAPGSQIEASEVHHLIADNTNIDPETVMAVETVEEPTDNTVVQPDITPDEQQYVSETETDANELAEPSVEAEQIDPSVNVSELTSIDNNASPTPEMMGDLDETQQSELVNSPVETDPVPMTRVVLAPVEAESISEPVDLHAPLNDPTLDASSADEAQFIENHIEPIQYAPETTEDEELDHSARPEVDQLIPEWLQTARGELSIRDYPGPFYEPRVFAYLQTTLQNPNSDETTWSSAFVNWCMTQSGHSGTNDTNARTWLNYGDVLNEPKSGCIVVLWKGSQQSHNGQVGFFDGFEGNRIRILGAHAGGGVDWEEVYVASYPQERVLGYRWPRDKQNELVQAPAMSEADPTHENHN